LPHTLPASEVLPTAKPAVSPLPDFFGFYLKNLSQNFKLNRRKCGGFVVKR